MIVNSLKSTILKTSLCILIVGISFTSCEKDNEVIVTPPPQATVRPDVVFYGLTDDNRILRYNAKTAEAALGTLNITGIQSGERLLSIDFRPATGQLYALGSTSRIYSINLNTGVATSPNPAQFSPVINGALASIDFNPTVDRIRLVTNTGQNLRLNPETGATAATDGSINGGASPVITNVAYTNSVAGTATTELYDIDFTTKKLYKQSPPNDGTLAEVGALNVNFTGKGGFDINFDNSVALANLTVGGVEKLFTINLMTGAATFLANLGVNLVDIAIPTQPVAYAVSTSGMLQIFNPLAPTAPVGKTITGIGVGESILGIDFRPTTGQLYGVTTTAAGIGRLYTFNLSSGAAAAVGTGFNIALGVTSVGFDFNPTVDRIRFVTNTGQNLRLNPNDGSIAASDGSLNPGTPAITGAAYTNNFAGATTTTLFVLDATNLYMQVPPNNGTLVTVGALGITNATQNGFDIGGASNNAFAIFTVGSASKVYTVNTITGAASSGVDYPNTVVGMSIGLGF